jgi:hypothetical protein
MGEPTPEQPVADACDFFAAVSRIGFPADEANQNKEQPWKKHWTVLPAPVTKNSKLLVACSVNYDFGSASLGGH